jgi:hypothetical protein
LGGAERDNVQLVAKKTQNCQNKFGTFLSFFHSSKTTSLKVHKVPLVSRKESSIKITTRDLVIKVQNRQTLRQSFFLMIRKSLKKIIGCFCERYNIVDRNKFISALIFTSTALK